MSTKEQMEREARHDENNRKQIELLKKLLEEKQKGKR